jgi:hypothetical protein
MTSRGSTTLLAIVVVVLSIVFTALTLADAATLPF